MERMGRVGTWPLAGLAPRRRLLVAGVLLLVVAVAAALTVRACAGRAGTPSGYPDQSRPGPVLLVPGYGGSQAALSVLAARIRATGRSATVLTLPGDGTGDLAVQAATLDGAPLPGRLPWLSIWASEDQTVRPPDSARLDGAVNVPVQSVCADAHLQH